MLLYTHTIVSVASPQSHHLPLGSQGLFREIYGPRFLSLFYRNCALEENASSFKNDRAGGGWTYRPPYNLSFEDSRWAISTAIFGVLVSCCNLKNMYKYIWYRRSAKTMLRIKREYCHMFEVPKSYELPQVLPLFL